MIELMDSAVFARFLAPGQQIPISITLTNLEQHCDSGFVQLLNVPKQDRNTKNDVRFRRRRSRYFPQQFRLAIRIERVGFRDRTGGKK